MGPSFRVVHKQEWISVSLNPYYIPSLLTNTRKRRIKRELGRIEDVISLDILSFHPLKMKQQEGKKEKEKKKAICTYKEKLQTVSTRFSCFVEPRNVALNRYLDTPKCFPYTRGSRDMYVDY